MVSYHLIRRAVATDSLPTTNTIEGVVIQKIVESAQSRPGSAGLDGTYGEYVAYFNGLHMGTGKRFLDGFGSWIASRSGKGGWNLVWQVLVLREAGFDDWITCDWHSLNPEEDKRAVAIMFDLLSEFLRNNLESTESLNETIIE